MTRRILTVSLLLAGALAAGCDSLEQNPVATSSKSAVFGSENGLALYTRNPADFAALDHLITVTAV